MKATFIFESTGKIHDDENGFFKFLAAEKIGNLLQFCTIHELSVTAESLTPEIVFWIYDIFAKNNCVINTETGYSYTLTSIDA